MKYEYSLKKKTQNIYLLINKYIFHDAYLGIEIDIKKKNNLQ